MLQNIVNNLAPIVILLICLGCSEARLARKRHMAGLREFIEVADRCVELEADLEDRDQAIARLREDAETTSSTVQSVTCRRSLTSHPSSTRAWRASSQAAAPCVRRSERTASSCSAMQGASPGAGVPVDVMVRN